MKAITFREYGSPDVLRCEDVDTPAPGDDDVLIKVHAASVNPLDWHVMRGSPYLLRLQNGWPGPKSARVGVDVAGRVEAVGKNVTQVRAGDHVFGAGRGAFAEYVLAAENRLAAKGAAVLFEQSAALPVAATTALQSLRDQGRIQPAQNVLINGAAGGVGTFAVQIARSFGARVTGVCSTTNVDMVRSIGADHVIDYTRDDFTASGQQYDLILDTVGNHSLSACRRAMTRNGTYVVVGRSLARAFRAPLLSPFVSQRLVMCVASINRADLALLNASVESKTITPVIDRRYALRDVPDAIRYLENGHARGKVVISVS